MFTPPFLEKNDTIGIVAPARSIQPEEIETAIQLFESWGLKVRLGKYLFKTYNQYAGTDEERAADFQEMLDNQQIKAIICARGGYGTIRTAERLVFNRFQKKPKWIVGYSDITVLHSYITKNLGIKTLHATMPLNIKKENHATNLLKKALFGNPVEFSWTNENNSNMPQKIEGQLTGGNLSVLYSLRGTPYDIDTRNTILFLEDLDEYLYHIDRMMMNLKTGGKLDNLKALLIGGMTDMNDNPNPYGKEAIEIIREHTTNMSYPVILNCPAGHIEHNFPLIMGGNAEIYKLNDAETGIRFTG